MGRGREGREAFMRYKGVKVIGAALLLALLAGCATQEMVRVRQMEINRVDLTRVRDGAYQGDFTYGGYTYVVEVTVKEGRITSISPTANRDTGPARQAEGVIPRILAEQRNEVDAVSGATTTSKALLKAIETALTRGL
jgi:uncharacterized protein with FMN-binding domain